MVSSNRTCSHLLFLKVKWKLFRENARKLRFLQLMLCKFSKTSVMVYCTARLTHCVAFLRKLHLSLCHFVKCLTDSASGAFRTSVACGPRGSCLL